MRQVVSMVARDTAFPLTPHIEEAVAILTPPPDSVVVQLAASWWPDSNINLFYLISFDTSLKNNVG